MSDVNYEIKRDSKTHEVRVDVTVAPERYAKTVEHAYNHLAPGVKIAGFRPGKAPKAQILQKLGLDLVNEAMRMLLPEVAAEIVEKENLNPITQLEYHFDDSPGEEVKFHFHFTGYPEIKVGNLKKIKVEKENSSVEESEVDDVLKRLFTPAHDHDHDHNHEDHDHDHDHPEVDVSAITPEQVEALEIPNIKTLPDLRAEIKTRLTESKAQNFERKYQDAVIEEAIEASEVPVPETFLNLRLEEEIADYEERVKELGMELDSFLVAQGKDRESFKKERADLIRKSIQAELLLNQIAKDHGAIPTAEDVEAELQTVSDPAAKAELDNYQGRRRILSMLIQQRGLQKLMELVKA